MKNAAGSVLTRIRELLRWLSRALYAVLPKLDYAVIWGWPDHEDNVLALERGLRETGRRVVILMTDRRASPPDVLGSRTHCVNKSTPLGFLAFLLARNVFFTHRCFMREFPPGVVSVNLWHGMPIKRTGLLRKGEDGIASSHVLATSPFWGEVMSRSMGPGPKVLTTGLPRNDRLFMGRSAAWEALGLAARDDVDHLLVWLPTYRRSLRGYVTVDGRPSDSPFELDDVDADALDAFLAERRGFAVVKPHPMAAFSGEERWDNLLLVDSAHLLARRLSLYQLLGAADALVSDMSSVTIDFLLLDRPIVHVIADLDEYRETRGFSVDRVEQLLSGPVVTNFADLLDCLDDVLGGGDPDADRRRRVRELSHSHPDGGATRRLLLELGLAAPALDPDELHYHLGSPSTGS